MFRLVKIYSILVILFPVVAYSQDDKPTLRGKSSKAPVSVLQNRFFQKAMRPELGLLAGSLLNEPYTDTTLYGLRLGFFFNEWVGVDLQYIKANVDDSEDRKALNKKEVLKEDATSVDDVEAFDPEVNEIEGITDFAIVYAPFYGKLNFADSFIVYSDLYLSGGLAKVSTQQGDKTAFSFGIGQRFYLFETSSIRVDFKTRSYVEKRNDKDSRKNALSVDLGYSYFFL